MTNWDLDEPVVFNNPASEVINVLAVLPLVKKWTILEPPFVLACSLCFAPSAWILIEASPILDTSNVLEYRVHLATRLLLFSCCNHVSYCLLTTHLSHCFFSFIAHVTRGTNARTSTTVQSETLLSHRKIFWERGITIFLKWKPRFINFWCYCIYPCFVFIHN